MSIDVTSPDGETKTPSRKREFVGLSPFSHDWTCFRTRGACNAYKYLAARPMPILIAHKRTGLPLKTSRVDKVVR